MIKRFLLILFLLGIIAVSGLWVVSLRGSKNVLEKSNEPHGEIPTSSLEVMPPMNVIYHPVTTTNGEAQESFDKGLINIFAYNHDLAFHEFENAAKLDPNLAMAYWGMALALGQNINEDIKPENEIRCYQYIQKALSLSSSASRSEQAYLSALATRYTNDPSVNLVSLRFRYRDAMRKLMQAYPEDLDAATLYAESILDLDPWKWWTLDGKPKAGIYEALDTLEFVLRRNPEHLGANHYYVHALEESPFPERALMSAHRLKYLLRESGHLLHMPTHIFLLVGDYEEALQTNKEAIIQDREYFQQYGLSLGSYPLHYLKHNLNVLTRIYMLKEDYQNAIDSAFELTKFIEPHMASMPHLATVLIVPMEVYLYFHKWEEILNHPLQFQYPPAQAYWHYSRAVAYASLGDLDSSLKERDLMNQAKKQITPKDEISSDPASRVLELASILLDATLANAQGNPLESIDYLKKAVVAQDTLYYGEPPSWYIPVRQILGFALLKQNQYEEAEREFLKVSKGLSRNGRTLFGLALSLKGQGRVMDAYWVEREMTAALKHATAPLDLDDL